MFPTVGIVSSTDTVFVATPAANSTGKCSSSPGCTSVHVYKRRSSSEGSMTIVTMPPGGTAIVICAPEPLPPPTVVHVAPDASCETSVSASCDVVSGGSTGPNTVTFAAVSHPGASIAASTAPSGVNASGDCDDDPHATKRPNQIQRITAR